MIPELESDDPVWCLVSWDIMLRPYRRPRRKLRSRKASFPDRVRNRCSEF